MRWTIERAYPKQDYIIGRLSIDFEPLCNTLELPWRDNAPNVSCIPPGRYQVYLTYSPKFGRDLPLVTGVPGRSGIRFHRANWPREIQGCIAPGENTVRGAVMNSTKYEEILVRKMKEARLRKEPVFLEIK